MHRLPRLKPILNAGVNRYVINRTHIGVEALLCVRWGQFVTLNTRRVHSTGKYRHVAEPDITSEGAHTRLHACVRRRHVHVTPKVIKYVTFTDSQKKRVRYPKRYELLFTFL